MAFLRSFLWSCCCIGFGIFLATVEVAGRTSLEHARLAWRRSVTPAVDGAVANAKTGLRDAKDSVQDRLAPKDRPREHVSAGDRAGLDSLIARKSDKK